MVETKICKHCNSNFEITDKDLEFYDKISPFFSGKKYSIPSPTLCPDCRQQRRLSFRNERNLYKRKCDKCNKNTVSVYSPDKNYIVYCSDCWKSDKFDAIDYGMNYNFEKAFFEQFEDLFRKVPKINLLQDGKMENSEYVQFGGWSKNCYMLFDSGKNEDSYYGVLFGYTKDCIDGYQLIKSQNCYEGINLSKSYKIFYSSYCNDCSDSAFLFDCTGCKNCIGCNSLNNKEYHVFNKAVSKKEYEEIYNNIFDGSNSSIENFRKKYIDFSKSIPRKNLKNINSKNSTGDELSNCENVYNSFGVDDSKDCKYVYDTFFEVQDACDTSSVFEMVNKAYELCSSGGKLGEVGLYNCMFGLYLFYGANNVYYSINCHNNCSNLFGCTGLSGKQFCILNKQYIKEEYEIFVPKIIEHMQIPHPNPFLRGEGEATIEWGEFFPSSMSPFGYNETVAMEYYPLTEQEATGHPQGVPLQKNECRGEPCVHPKNGIFNWSTYEAPFPKVEKIIPANKLPDNISDIPDDILNWAIECEISKKPFRIIAQELEFYRKHNLPIPRRHPDQRHLDRMILRNPRKLYDRKCDKCGIEIKTTYSPEREEIVYCEGCYNKEIY